MSNQYKLVTCTINGKERSAMVDVRASLTDMLRNDYGLTSVKKGCEVGECGACAVIIDGECFNSCIYLAVWADGKNITTLEGLTSLDGTLSDIQQAFVDEAAILRDLCSKLRLFCRKEKFTLTTNCENYYLDIYAVALATKIFCVRSRKLCIQEIMKLYER